MKTVYQTDAEGFFIGPIAADPSPLEPGVWLIPGGAVEAAPPALSQGQRAQWANGAWAVIDPPPPPPEPEPTPPTPEQIIDAFRRAIDAHVEAQARAWQYNSAAHLASYVPSTVAQWAAEATAFAAWRDAVWLAALALLDDVQAGTAEPPADPSDFIVTLPSLVRPT